MSTHPTNTPYRLIVSTHALLLTLSYYYSQHTLSYYHSQHTLSYYYYQHLHPLRSRWMFLCGLTIRSMRSPSYLGCCACRYVTRYTSCLDSLCLITLLIFVTHYHRIISPSPRRVQAVYEPSAIATTVSIVLSRACESPCTLETSMEFHDQTSSSSSSSSMTVEGDSCSTRRYDQLMDCSLSR